MDFGLTAEQSAIRDSIKRICDGFGDDYWREHDNSGAFPTEFHRAIAEGGWLGIAMPEEFGGAALGVTEAAIMMHAIAGSSGAMAAASSVHINIFGPHPIVVHGTREQKQRWLPPLIAGQARTCFGVTEPDAGLDTGRIKTRADRVQGGYVVHGQKIWTSTAQQADNGNGEQQAGITREAIPGACQSIGFRCVLRPQQQSKNHHIHREEDRQTEPRHRPTGLTFLAAGSGDRSRKAAAVAAIPRLVATAVAGNGKAAKVATTRLFHTVRSAGFQSLGVHGRWNSST